MLTKIQSVFKRKSNLPVVVGLIVSLFLVVRLSHFQVADFLPTQDGPALIYGSGADTNIGYEVNSKFTRKDEVNGRVDSRSIFYQNRAEVDTGKNILFLLSIGPSNAYGEGRTFEDLLNFLHATEYPTEKLSLGLLIVNKEEFEAIDKRITQYYEEATPSTKKFQSIKLSYAPFLESSTLDREERHHNDKQKERRRTLARARNYLLYNTMDHQDYVLWIDADIISLPDRILTTFVESDRDIITIRITQGNQNDYDRNAWVGARAKPSSEQLAQMKNDPKYVYVPHNSGDTKNLAVFANGKEEFVELDSVGGTVLFVKAEIHKQGVSHTPYYAIGTDFGIKEGYDGIETEGLCYVAQALGYKCWGMPLVTGEHVL